MTMQATSGLAVHQSARSVPNLRSTSVGSAMSSISVWMASISSARPGCGAGEDDQLLVGEVVEDGLFADDRGFGDLADGYLREAVLLEERHGLLDDGLFGQGALDVAEGECHCCTCCKIIVAVKMQRV